MPEERIGKPRKEGRRSSDHDRNNRARKLLWV